MLYPPVHEECKKVLDLLFELRRRADSYQRQGQHQKERKVRSLIENLLESFDLFLGLKDCRVDQDLKRLEPTSPLSKNNPPS